MIGTYLSEACCQKKRSCIHFSSGGPGQQDFHSKRLDHWRQKSVLLSQQSYHKLTYIYVGNENSFKKHSYNCDPALWINTSSCKQVKQNKEYLLFAAVDHKVGEVNWFPATFLMPVDRGYRTQLYVFIFVVFQAQVCWTAHKYWVIKKNP